MAIPKNATEWDAEMDPTDLVDYVVWLRDPEEPLLEVGESVTSFTVALSAEAVALGLEINNDPPYILELFDTGSRIKVWFSVALAFRANAAFDGDGVKLGVEVTINTNSNPPRRRQKTMVLKVAQQ